MSDDSMLRRPAFFDGQALTAADLGAVRTYHEELLWLHQRALHGFGIASGLAVTGASGDKVVAIAPGYAVDVRGRSIVLSGARVKAVPAVVAAPTGKAAVFHLTASYVSDADLPAVLRAGSCASSGAVWRAEEPLLLWQEPNAVDLERTVVLGTISVRNCALAAAVDGALRRSVIPEKQPYVYAAQTTVASKDWSPWHPDDVRDDPIGITTTVSTSAAGFANTPHYTAHVVGDRTVTMPGRKPAVLDGYAQIGSASSTSFRLSVTLPPAPGIDDPVNPRWALAPDVIANLSWSVSWLGVES
jgi:hypothetical protein